MTLLKKSFSLVFSALSYLVKGHMLKKEDGARFLSTQEEKSIFQAGKTTSYIVPNVLDKAKKKCSLVVTDPSGDHTRRIKKSYKINY